MKIEMTKKQFDILLKAIIKLKDKMCIGCDSPSKCLNCNSFLEYCDLETTFNRHDANRIEKASRVLKELISEERKNNE